MLTTENHKWFKVVGIKISFEHVDSWAKSLLFRTHDLWNATTELILLYTQDTIKGAIYYGLKQILGRNPSVYCCCRKKAVNYRHGELPEISAFSTCHKKPVIRYRNCIIFFGYLSRCINQAIKIFSRKSLKHLHL